MRHNQTSVWLRLGTLRGPLTLRRVPKFLRFVVAGTDWATLDALDQLDDVPKPGERVIAARKVDESRVHFDGTKGGRRVGWYENTAIYEPVTGQPSQDVLADTARWQAWCVETAAQPPAIRVVNVTGMNRPEPRAGVVYLGRPFAGWAGHPLANPFKPGAGLSLGVCLDRYRDWLLARADLDEQLAAVWEATRFGRLPLGCWCLTAALGDGQPIVCHAQIVAHLLARFLPNPPAGG